MDAPSRRAPPLRATLFRIALALLAGLAFWCCELGGTQPEPKELITILVPDSLSRYDTVRVALLAPGGADTLEILWNGPLAKASDLRRLAPRAYAGGPVDVYIEGRKNGLIGYRKLTRYREAGRKPETITLSLPARKDVVRPIVSLNEDTLMYIGLGESYTDAPVSCQDDRDGPLKVERTGSVNTAKLGDYPLTYLCTDSAGNVSTPRTRLVKVVIAPDKASPSVLLAGLDSMTVEIGHRFADPGATCIDDRDKSLKPKVTGTVDTAKAGIYVLTYACTDSAGNRSAPRTRNVRVLETPDAVRPVLKLRSSDTLEANLGVSLRDTGAVCADDRDGPLPVTVSGGVDVSKDGDYTLSYACADKAGNVSGLDQVIRVKRRTVFRFEKETTIDTLDLARNPNQGYTGVLAFTEHPTDRYVTVVKIGLSQVSKAGLKSAKIRFLTYGGGDSPWPGTPMTLDFRIYAVKSEWTEGRGNWYWASGGWQNNGETLLSNYGLSDSVKARSANPLSSTGLAPEDKAIARARNLDSLSMERVTLTYDVKHGIGPVPAPKDLVTLDLEITDYVRNTDPAREYGLLITVAGVPAGEYIAFLTKEIGDGTFGPQLILEY
jgi:hypothetical protein